MRLMTLTCLQSQPCSAIKDAGDAPVETQVVTDTERLRNQFNFNDRTAQVGAPHLVALPEQRCARTFGERCRCSAVNRAEAARTSMSTMMSY